MEFDPKNLNDVCYLTIDNIESTKIGPSSIHGFGLFAKKDIKQNTLLCLLEGQLLDRKDYKRIGDYCKPLVESLDNYLFMECNYVSLEHILVRPFRTKYSYINHSNTPNVSLFYNPIRIEAVAHIKPGDELTIDYTKESLSGEYLSHPDKTFLVR
jgi:SET domain-containing protein